MNNLLCRAWKDMSFLELWTGLGSFFVGIFRFWETWKMYVC